jgi:hypothetical protein
MKHPAFAQQLAIPPKPKMNCREGVVFIHTPGSGHHRSRPELPERLCAGSVTFLTDRLQTPARFDRLARQRSGIQGRCVRNVRDRTRTFRLPCIRRRRRLHCRLSPVRRANPNSFAFFADFASSR